MSSFVEADILKMSKIDADIKVLRDKIKQLQTTRTQIESQIKTYLKGRGESAVESGGLIIKLETHDKHRRMSKPKLGEFLRLHGVSEEVIEECLYNNQGIVEKLRVEKRR